MWLDQEPRVLYDPAVGCGNSGYGSCGSLFYHRPRNQSGKRDNRDNFCVGRRHIVCFNEQDADHAAHRRPSDSLRCCVTRLNHDYTFTDLDQGVTYYGWAVATKQGAESDVIGTASITTINPEDWWEPGVNLVYRKALNNSKSAIHIKSISGFTGGNLVARSAVVDYFGINFISFEYNSTWFSDLGDLYTRDDLAGNILTGKITDNVVRKRFMDKLALATGSTLNPEFKTWT